MTIEAVILWSLVCWRIVALLVYDTIMDRARKWIGVAYNEYSECMPKTFVAAALCCHKCTSIWVALGISLIVFRSTPETFIAGTLALSAGSIIINKIVNGE